MLQPWQIEKLRQERENRKERERPAIHAPQPRRPQEQQERPSEDPPKRGIAIIDFSI